MKKMFLGQSYNWVYPLLCNPAVKVPSDRKARAIAGRASRKVEEFFQKYGKK